MNDVHFPNATQMEKYIIAKMIEQFTDTNYRESDGIQQHFLYMVSSETSHTMKIGVTKNLDTRISGLQTGSPDTLKCYAYFEINSKSLAYWMESKFHAALSPWRISREWFLKNEFTLNFFGELGGKLCALDGIEFEILEAK